MAETWVTLRAHGKLNLCLEVLGRRADGFHGLATIFQAVALHDTVRLELGGRTGGPVVGGSGWPMPSGPGNLCWRAAVAFAGDIGDDRGLLRRLTVRVTKRLPPGGGLGGGSSDAAATLVGLNRLAGEPLGGQDILRLAAALGSDVAFFALGAPAALATGRGEVLAPLPAAEGLHVVLLWPGAPVSTAWAYGRLTPGDFSDGAAARRLAQAMASHLPPDLRPFTGANAFLRPVAAERLDVAAALPALHDAGAAPVSLAGSGACVWGAFADAAAAEDAAIRLAAAGYWAQAARQAHQGVVVVDESG
jgi:4-diphosphocytidyl-2-C-methyl-D-erythritol kinase